MWPKTQQTCDCVWCLTAWLYKMFTCIAKHFGQDSQLYELTLYLTVCQKFCVHVLAVIYVAVNQRHRPVPIYSCDMPSEAAKQAGANMHPVCQLEGTADMLPLKKGKYLCLVSKSITRTHVCPQLWGQNIRDAQPMYHVLCSSSTKCAKSSDINLSNYENDLIILIQSCHTNYI
jgi:hypothetical protein